MRWLGGQHLNTGHRPGAAPVQQEAWEAREYPHAELGKFTSELARAPAVGTPLGWQVAARGPLKAHPEGLRHHGQDPYSLRGWGLCWWRPLTVPLVSHQPGRQTGAQVSVKSEDDGEVTHSSPTAGKGWAQTRPSSASQSSALSVTLGRPLRVGLEKRFPWGEKPMIWEQSPAQWSAS